MADYIIQDTTLIGIADAIRGKTGGTDPIPVADMAAQIAGISGGCDTVEVTAALAMADGDQVIEPAEGQVMSKVTVQKPATLLPENIAEGVDIAGVIGSLVAGGSSGGVLYKAASIKGVDSSNRYSIDFGFIPDILVIIPEFYNTSLSTNGLVYYGISKKLAEAIGTTATQYIVYSNSKTISRELYSSQYITDEQSVYYRISGADETGFFLSNSTPQSGQWMTVIAFGGLA